ncbi:MAG: hypothetical protein LC802_12320, partial [Acidobacteria bacterium]|nr:hypothetical protein [Acidobacteriota bacterium]
MLNRTALRLNRSGDVYASAQESGLTVNFVAGERAVAATYAQVHVHHEQVRAVNDSGGNLFPGCRNTSLVRGPFRRAVVGRRELRKIFRDHFS